MAGPRAPLVTLLPLALAAACAAPGPYPSLAPRPAETAYAGEDERQPTPQPDDPALAREIERLTAAARGGSAEFEASLRAAEAAASAAGASGSDSWVEAQQALSRLETARAQTTAALADLDRLAVERASAGTLSDDDREALRAAAAELQALADAQAERLRRIGERLSR
ncbi:MAG: hypothetical protein QOG72_1040 [Sphingomonadales bacterium]|jgi:hypothetical protein|nr:hypothetical protein [Sphingomonadales bacterium]